MGNKETITKRIKNEVTNMLLDLKDRGYSFNGISFLLEVDTHSIRRWLNGECIPNGVCLELLSEFKLVSETNLFINICFWVEYYLKE